MAVEVKKMSGLSNFYDKKANVLYISVGKPKAATSLALRSGILVRSDRKTGEFVGVTVIDFDAARHSDYRRILQSSRKIPSELLPDVIAQIDQYKPQ